MFNHQTQPKLSPLHTVAAILTQAVKRDENRANGAVSRVYARNKLDFCVQWSGNKRTTHDINKSMKTNTKVNSSIIQQVVSLPDLTIEELRNLWRSVFDTEPPPYKKTYLIPRLAYRLQELTYGTLSDKATQHLDYLADQMEKGKKFTHPFLASKPRSGTKLIRDYQGVPHEVMVIDKGFMYQGQTYKSLSVIARKITNTRRNGPAFFGLRNKKQHERDKGE